MKVKRQHIRCLPTSYSTRQCKSFFFFCSKPPAPLFGGNRDWCFSSEARNRIFIDDAVVCSDSWLIQNGSELHTKCSLGLMPRCIRWHKTMFASHRRNGCDQQHIYRFCCFFFFFLFSIIFIIIFRFLIIIFVRCCKPPLPSPTSLPLSWIFILSAFIQRSLARCAGQNLLHARMRGKNAKKDCLLRQESLFDAVQNAPLILPVSIYYFNQAADVRRHCFSSAFGMRIFFRRSLSPCF